MLDVINSQLHSIKAKPESESSISALRDLLAVKAPYLLDSFSPHTLFVK